MIFFPVQKLLAIFFFFFLPQPLHAKVPRPETQPHAYSRDTSHSSHNARSLTASHQGTPFFFLINVL